MASRQLVKAAAAVVEARPSRDDQMDKLKRTEFDVLVIGGGASGCGVALDAATRGLSVAMCERGDFASGTSSRSSKLVHGGIRYLQNAVFKASVSEYRLVKEALREREVFSHTAPHLVSMLPIMLPVYGPLWRLPYYFSGCLLYDAVAGELFGKHRSYLMSPAQALAAFPQLRPDGLRGAVVYHDGQHNDARMNVALGVTAADKGATVATYTEVVGVVKDDAGRVVGVNVKDSLDPSAKPFTVRAKVVVNATGPFSDAVRQMDDPEVETIVVPSRGTHVVLPNFYSPSGFGLIDPATSDGRVIFFLPWLDATVVGTTDVAAEVSKHPAPTEDEVVFVLKEVEAYLTDELQMRRSDVLSAWAGLRPLAKDPATSTGEKGTASISRSHVVNQSPSGMFTLAGGKWTTYRAMAEDAVDAVLAAHPDLAARAGKCVTAVTQVAGAEGYTPNLNIRLIQAYGVDSVVADHLAHTYGVDAHMVCALAKPTGWRWPVVGRRLVPTYPFIEAEVLFAVRHEYAMTVTDVLARRTRLAFLNTDAAREVMPKLVDIMAKELKWDAARRRREEQYAAKWLDIFGGPRPIAKRHPGMAQATTPSGKLHMSFLTHDVLDALRAAGVEDSLTLADLKHLAASLGADLTDDEVRVVFMEMSAGADTATLEQVEAWWAGGVKSRLSRKLSTCMGADKVSTEYP